VVSVVSPVKPVIIVCGYSVLPNTANKLTSEHLKVKTERNSVTQVLAMAVAMAIVQYVIMS